MVGAHTLSETQSHIYDTPVNSGELNGCETREVTCVNEGEHETETNVTYENDYHSRVTRESNSCEQRTNVNLSETKVNNDCKYTSARLQRTNKCKRK